MSKVICDICGTTFPETASVCPICGCAKNTTEQTVADIAPSDESIAATYTKGGHFSKSNVRKRNKQKAATKNQPEGDGVNKGLVVVVVLLLLAIAAVLIYIGVRFFAPTPDNDPADTGNRVTTSTTPSSSVIPDSVEVPCTELKLSCTTIELTKEGDALLLNVTVFPENTTDKITFASSDVNVATVSENGNVVVVGSGEAVITVTCGTVTAECKVIGAFGEESEPSEPTEPSVSIPEGFVLKLKGTFEKNGFTISERYPAPVAIYKEIDGVKATDITWTSDNEEVATINEKGVVTAVGKGNTKVYGTLGDQKVSCMVIVAFTPEAPSEMKYVLSDKDGDATLYIGGNDSFNLYLMDPEQGNAKVQNVVWVANEEGYVEIDGTTIRALKSTKDLKNKYVLVSATIDDCTYSCKVRIEEKKVEE